MESQILQSIGLILDVIGVLLIIKFFKKTKYRESSPFGIPTNQAEILTNLSNEGRTGSYFLVVGFFFQLIALWIEQIILFTKELY